MSLRVKLTLALLFTSLSGVTIVTVLVQRFTAAEFDNFVVEQERANFIDDLTAYYEVNGSWDNMRIVRGKPSSSEQKPQNTFPDSPVSLVQFMLIDQAGIVVIPGKDYAPGQQIPDAELQHADPVILDGETIGYVITGKKWGDHNRLAEAYLDRINQLLLIAMGGAVVLALLLSFLFARSLSKPLREIATAIQSIANGNLDQQVPVHSRDGIGQVAAAFNQMSANLARANRLRRQMTADIAHELRTPLSVVVGYLASLSEGLLKPNIEQFKIMHDEARHLQRLVEDLRILSLADAGELPLNFQPVAPGELINIAVAAFSQRAEQRHVTLSVEPGPNVRLLHADPDRILQVLSNLLSNALRHTPEQGRITLASRTDERQIVLSVRDTGPGIDPDHLPHIFERFYRADSSRHQTQNESGLGLAIAKSIVEAHGGQILATSTPGEGTTISLALPHHKSTEDTSPQ